MGIGAYDISSSEYCAMQSSLIIKNLSIKNICERGNLKNKLPQEEFGF